MLPILPDPPSRNDPDNFSNRADAFLGALPAWTDAANALEQSLQLVATTGTSSTSLAIGAGTKALTTQSGKAWIVGAFVYVVSASSIANLMLGQVTSYDSVTGALVVSVNGTMGSGTFASWVIGLTVPMDASPVFSGPVSAQKFSVDSHFSMSLVSSDPVLELDTTDFLTFHRSGNSLDVVIGGVSQFTVDATDGPQRTGDAATANGLVRKSQMEAALVPLATSASVASAIASAVAGVTASAFGVGQTFQDVTGSRSVGTAYNNGTGKPILMIVAGESSGGSPSQGSATIRCAPTLGALPTAVAANLSGYASAGGYKYPIVCIVPDGHYYQVNFGNLTLNSWIELR